MNKENLLKIEYEKCYSTQKYNNSVIKNMIEKYVFPAMEEYAKYHASLAFDAGRKAPVYIKVTGTEESPILESEEKKSKQQYLDKVFNQ